MGEVLKQHSFQPAGSSVFVLMGVDEVVGLQIFDPYRAIWVHLAGRELDS